MKIFGRSFSWKRMIDRMTGGQMALLGFGSIAVFGMLLLMLPAANVHGYWTNPVDALFTSVSALCVTGLIVLPTGTYWTLFGQIVIIMLIEVGGLGFMTFMTLFFVATGRRITIHNRLLIQSSVNSDHIQGIVKFVKYIILYALIIEAVGGLLLTIVFAPIVGLGKGLYYGFWHSISMYCNAGFDLMASEGMSSFTSFVNNPLLNFTVCALIVIGGLGFAVYIDLLDYGRQRRLNFNTKVVLLVTGILLVGGGLLFYFFERNNPATMGELPWYGKFLASMFQSVTPRTAGANTIDQAAMTPASLLLTDILMFIGASPGSTGGGIKTTTIAVILLTLWSVLMGRKHVNCRNREIQMEVVRRAMSIFMIGIGVVIVTFFIMLLNEPGVRSDFIIFEIFSAYDTVGLSCGITAALHVPSKLALIFCMFVGRVGPLTIAYVLTNTERRMLRNQGNYVLPPANIIIG